MIHVAEALREIQPKDVLPLVIFPNYESYAEAPNRLNKVVTFKGRMTKETEFWLPESSGEQMFFCSTIIQRQNSEPKNCFIRENFKENSPLRCNLEPVPIIEEMRSLLTKCGIGKIGNIYGVFYKVILNYIHLHGG